jgi:DNA (cytosine-5)-methyltransferase 1
MGYYRAGFEVTGIDVKNQKRYPFEFIKADAIEVLKDIDYLKTFDILVGSPPCQTHSITQHLRNAQGKGTDKIDLIPETREGFIASGKPYVIENVPGSPLNNPLTLCGSSFDLKVRRHRLFESNILLTGLACNHKKQGKPVGIYGSMPDQIPGGGHTAKTIEQAREAMGIDWMLWGDLVEAIPPVYTEFIGKQIIERSFNG